MGAHVELDVTVKLGFARTNALRRQIEDLQRRYEERAEPGGPALLLRVAGVLVRDVERRLERHSQPDSDAGPQELAALRGVAIADVRTLEQHVGRCLDLVATPHGRDMDAFVEPVGRLAKSLAPETEVIFRPMVQSSPYAIAPAPINEWLTQFAARGASGLAAQVSALPPIVRLQYPAIAESEVTHHLLLGHEIAHLALRTHLRGSEPLHDHLVGRSYRAYRSRLFAERDAGRLTDAELPTSDEWLAISKRSESWFLELACDRLAVRLMGPAYFLALSEQASLEPWFYEPADQDPESVWAKYPAMAWRLQSTWQMAEPVVSGLQGEHSDRVRAVFQSFVRRMPELDGEVPEHEKAIVDDALRELDGASDPKSLAPADELLRVPEAAYPMDKFGEHVALIWQLLDDGISPAELVHCRDEPSSPNGSWAQGGPWSAPLDWRSILNVGYLHWLSTAPGPEDDWASLAESRDDLNQLLRGSVELSEVHRRAKQTRTELRGLIEPVAKPHAPRFWGAAPQQGLSLGKLARHEIIGALTERGRQFAVTPILDPDEQFGPAALDVRLGPDLVVSRRASGAVAFDAADVETVASRLEDYQQYIRRPFGSAVYLHPGDFALARTLEYVRLPPDIAAEAIGRSSWGRLGLVIATATLIQPDFKGTITLELANLGNIPMVLYVGMRIAQLTFSQLSPQPVAGSLA